MKQIDSILPCVCSVIERRERQNVVRTSVTHSAAPRVPLLRTATWVTHSAALLKTHVIYIYLYINCNARVRLFGHLFATPSFMLHSKQASGDC